MADHQHHQSDHHHHHGPRDQHGHDASDIEFTEANRKHWNDFAANYTSEQWQKDLINKITEFILENIDWIGVPFIDPSTTFEKNKDSKQSIRVLDYACGPGTVTNALGSRATEYVGLDLSENMVKAYNLRFAPDSEVTDSEKLNAHATVGNLLEEKETPKALDDPKFFNFDLVVVGLGFHHFSNLQLSTKRLVERLKPGGVFLIIDFLPFGTDMIENKHPAAHTVAHHGFSEEGIKRLFGEAGLKDVGVVPMNGTVLMRGLNPRTPFLAKGTKPKL